MALRRTVNPASEPVTVTEAKAALRVDGADEDTYIESLITAAREWCETMHRRAYLTQTWRYTLDCFPSCGPIYLPRPPLIAVSSITYVDDNGDTQTLASSAYRVDSDSEPARITEAFGSFWPTTRDVTNAVTITFTAGYGAAATSVPAKVKQAILLLVGHWYENREATGQNVGKEIEFAVTSLLWGDRVFC